MAKMGKQIYFGSSLEDAVDAMAAVLDEEFGQKQSIAASADPSIIKGIYDQFVSYGKSVRGTDIKRQLKNCGLAEDEIERMLKEWKDPNFDFRSIWSKL